MTDPSQIVAKLPKTKTAIRARDRLRRYLFSPRNDTELWHEIQERVPEAWATLKDDLPDEEPKVKLTLRLDESVVKMFRATGPGYQARMNLVLATYVQMQIGEVHRERRAVTEVIEEIGYPFDDRVLSVMKQLGLAE